jgi:hypothetical protein
LGDVVRETGAVVGVVVAAALDVEVLAFSFSGLRYISATVISVLSIRWLENSIRL